MEIFSDFGWIKVNFEKYEEDIVIDYRGKVYDRPKHLSRGKKAIYGHTPFTLEELREIIRLVGDFDLIVIGNGQYGRMPVEDNVIEYLKDINKRFIITDTQKAIEEFLNKFNIGIKVIAVFHITC